MFRTKRGELTAYAFACGATETVAEKEIIVSLSWCFERSLYIVRYKHLRQLYGNYRYFKTLKEARKYCKTAIKQLREL